LSRQPWNGRHVAGNFSERLVNFDTNVIAPNTLNSSGAIGIGYNKANNTCTLVCHSYSHNYDGTVTLVNSTRSPSAVKTAASTIKR